MKIGQKFRAMHWARFRTRFREVRTQLAYAPCSAESTGGGTNPHLSPAFGFRRSQAAVSSVPAYSQADRPHPHRVPSLPRRGGVKPIGKVGAAAPAFPRGSQAARSLPRAKKASKPFGSDASDRFGKHAPGRRLRDEGARWPPENRPAARARPQWWSAAGWRSRPGRSPASWSPAAGNRRPFWRTARSWPW